MSELPSVLSAGRRFTTSQRVERARRWWWTMLLGTLAAPAAAGVAVAYFLIAEPGGALAYGLLRRAGRVTAPERFAVGREPAGGYFSARSLGERFGRMTEAEVARANEGMLRRYVGNFHKTAGETLYAEGRFVVVAGRRLGEGDVFGSGAVALVRSVEAPEIFLECVYPAAAESGPVLENALVRGREVILARGSELSVVLRAGKLVEGGWKFTVVPLSYGHLRLGEEDTVCNLEPPAWPNLRGRWPLMPDAMCAGLPVKLEPPVGLTTGGALAALPGQRRSLSDLLRDGLPGSRPPPEPEGPKGKPGKKKPEKKLPPPPKVVESVVEVPAPAPAPVSAPAPEPVAELWELYAPGRMPRGRLVAAGELSRLAAGDLAAGTSYVCGDFVVVATGQSRAVLRAAGADGRAKGGMRLVVDFPAGMAVPAEGARVSRGPERPFLLLRMEAGGGEDEVNVFGREVMAP